MPKFLPFNFWNEIEAEGIDPNRVYYVYLKFNGKVSLGHLRWLIRQVPDKGEFEAAYILFDYKELMEYFMLSNPQEVIMLVDYYGIKSKYLRSYGRKSYSRTPSHSTQRTFNELGEVIGTNTSGDTTANTEASEPPPESWGWPNKPDAI